MLKFFCRPPDSPLDFGKSGQVGRIDHPAKLPMPRPEPALSHELVHSLPRDRQAASRGRDLDKT